MASSNDLRQLIRNSYECMRKIMELDTQSTLTNFNVMETLNNSAILRYRELEPYLDSLESETSKIRTLDQELAKNQPRLEQLEERTKKLAMLVEQMDEWSAELEVKSRHKGDDSEDPNAAELLMAAQALGELKSRSEPPKSTILDKVTSHPLISSSINYMLEKTINTSSNIVLLNEEKSKRARNDQQTESVGPDMKEISEQIPPKRPKLEKTSSGSQLNNRLPPPSQPPRFARLNSSLRQQVTISSAISTQRSLQDLTELSVLNLNIESRRRLTMLINFLKIGNTQLSERIENLINVLANEHAVNQSRSSSPDSFRGGASTLSLPSLASVSSATSLASLPNSDETPNLSPEAEIPVQQLKNEIVGTVKKIVNVVSKVSANSLPEPARSNVREMLLKLPTNWAMSLEQNMSEPEDEDSDDETKTIYEDSVEYPDQTAESQKRKSRSLAQQLLANLFKYRNKRQKNAVQPNTWFKKSIRDQILSDRNGKVLILAQESLDMINKIIKFCNENLDKAETWNISKQTQQAAHLMNKLQNITYVTPVSSRDAVSDSSDTQKDSQDGDTIVVREDSPSKL
ncbi:hypothetical protein KL929_002040 [Ogataea haglerorum]|nr:hypothetical protein KL929_002040 [Ogataea haglerorum]